MTEIHLPDGTTLTGDAARKHMEAQQAQEMARRRWQMAEAMAGRFASMATSKTGLPAPEALAALVGRDRACLILDAAGIGRPASWLAEQQRIADDPHSERQAARTVWSADVRHDHRVMQAISDGTSAAAALEELASDQTAHPAARQVAFRAADLIKERGFAPLDAIEEAEAARSRPSRPDPGVRLPGLARRLDEAGRDLGKHREELAGYAPMGVVTGDKGEPVQVSRAFPGPTQDGLAHGWTKADDREEETPEFAKVRARSAAITRR